MSSVEITRDDVLKAVKKDVNSENVELIEYEIKQASETPIGFLGDHKRIKGKAKYDGKEKEFQYFTKIVPTKVASHREYCEKTGAFFKEIELYKTLFEDMKNAVSVNRRQLKWRPDGYFTRDWDTLILEDLSLQDYYMLPEGTFMGLEYAQETVKALARMNAETFIFEAKVSSGKAKTVSKHYKPGSGNVTVQDLYPELVFETECVQKPGHPGYAFYEAGIRSQSAVIDLLPDYTAEQKEKVKELFPNCLREIYELVKPSKKWRNVITHADIWTNNVLFKNDSTGKLTDGILIDFQLARYQPPAQDLLLMLHTVQTKAFREQHENSLTDLYYETLSNELKEEELNIDDFVTKAEFEESLKFYKKFAILMNIIYTQLNQIPPAISERFMATTESYAKMMFEDRSELLVELFHGSEKTRSRQIDEMDEMIQICNLL